ncbi:MAG: toprim domain-containing protein [Bacteroidales bacterium]|nr:toprim domain-containing protein [Bacteroidales bacterium]
MAKGEPTYDDFLRQLSIQDLLLDAGYELNERDGLRYPAYIRTDSTGTRVRGDKFVVTSNGKCCFQPPEQKLYNIISFIKTFPDKFREHRPGMSPDRLVNLVCNRLMHNPVEDRTSRIVQPRQDNVPFDLSSYDVHRFDPNDRETQRQFYPYFKNRGIDILTQKAFADHFMLAARHRADGQSYFNLAFPMSLPKDPDRIVGLEERGRPKMDGSSSYKGKALGSNSSEGLWIANLGGEPLGRAGGIAWFESAYDAMAFYQIHRETFRNNPELSAKSVFVSTGGTPTEMQIRGMLAAAPYKTHYLCFDNDFAGRNFADKFRAIAARMNVPSENIRTFPLLPYYKDWNDALLERTSQKYIDSVRDLVTPLDPLPSRVKVEGDEEIHAQSYHR